MLYTFLQHPANGFLTFDEASGLTAATIVEAESSEEAVRRAQFLGIYLNGVEHGLDKKHNRWTKPLLGRIHSRSPGDIPEGKRMCIHWLDNKRSWS